VDVRLLPFLFLCYILAYLDRVNVGFAKLQMLKDLSLSDAAFATGAGIFFIGYFFFEVPSNVLLKKYGARMWIARIMISWGIISACMMFVKGAWSFYAMRCLLGFAEADSSPVSFSISRSGIPRSCARCGPPGSSPPSPFPE
jgi:sugar phosphate permease